MVAVPDFVNAVFRHSQVQFRKCCAASDDPAPHGMPLISQTYPGKEIGNNRQFAPLWNLLRQCSIRVGNDMTFRLYDADPIGLAMDWLEACRSQQATALCELYAEAATLECECCGPVQLVGRAGILEYWRPKLAAPPPRPFRLEQIWPEAQGVALVYRYREPTLIRTSFQFDAAGKIERSRCRPEPQLAFARPAENTGAARIAGATPEPPLDA